MPMIDPPQAIARASLTVIALLGLGTVLLAVQTPVLAAIAAAALGPMFAVVPAVRGARPARLPRSPVGWIYPAAGIALAAWAFSASYGSQPLSASNAVATR